jgi:hypothetical protein
VSVTDLDYMQAEIAALKEQNDELLERMCDWRECAESLYEGMQSAISAGDWKVDGACDPDSAMAEFRRLVGGAK